VIFITVDPERDTPEVIKAYTAAFDPSFIGLYGDAKRTRETADEFKVYYKQVPTGSSYTMDHSALSYAFDPQGRLRLALRHEQTAEDYAHDLRQLLAGK
jgi:protein SCO1/2